MKKTIKYFKFITFITIIMIISGCASLLYGVHIRSYGNLSSVLPGGTLNFSSTGRGINWAVSSTNNGSGPVAAGTSISQNGVLTVDRNETALILYVIAKSTKDGFSDIKQIRVVTVSGVAITPTGQPVSTGRTLQFRAQVTGNNNPDSAVTWRVSSNAAGTGSVTHGTNINANGLLTAASNETAPILYIFATSVVDPSKFSSINIGVVIPIVTGVAVSPPTQSITSGSSLQFNAAVTGTNNPDPAVMWRVSSNTAGTGAVMAGTNINANGVLTVAPNETAPILYIFAISVANPSISGNSYVNVIVPVVTGVAVSPPTQSMTRGSALQFSAAVTGSNNPGNAVMWKVSSNAAGTGAVTAGTSINANGVLTVAANETAPILYVFATSVINPSRSGNASVTVTAPAASSSTTGSGVTGPAVSGSGASGSNTTGRGTTSPSVTGSGTTTSGTTSPGGTTSPSVTGPTATGIIVTNITVNPSTFATKTNTTVQFNAAVTGTNNPSNAVTWKVSSNPAGTGTVAPGTSVSASGLLKVAPNEWATTLYVFATSVVDPNKSASAAVTITNNTGNQGSNQGQAQGKN
ncbi:MAG: hypothetical protein FWE72_06545 [Spirochaetaceae bacterium]|nr:hypothetical protein [Spirochaetaceae bacterium]